ncbi:hypothetical protein HFA01_28590 [Halobacillus faecis]|uniref:Uncharacterized protein n=1 Tax=Halobacillus faecis TaxID=360184 RepID=A0A511WUK3_9BACI|nr:hypothetical protein HFA01_28590 [Halobacillus faecis]
MSRIIIKRKIFEIIRAKGGINMAQGNKKLSNKNAKIHDRKEENQPREKR